jgi:hypothetical protein
METWREQTPKRWRNKLEKIIKIGHDDIGFEDVKWIFWLECLEYENKLLASKEGGDILDYMIDLRLFKRTVMYKQQLLSQTCQNDWESSL